MPPCTRLRNEVPISIAANPRTAPQSVKPTNRASRTINDVRFTSLICGNALICARLRDDAHLAKHPFPSALRTLNRGSFIIVRIRAFLIVKARTLTFWATTHPNSLDDLFPRHSTVPDCRIWLLAVALRTAVAELPLGFADYVKSSTRGQGRPVGQ